MEILFNKYEINSLATAKNAAELSKGILDDWATETFQVAKEAYCLPSTKTVMKSGTKLGLNIMRSRCPSFSGNSQRPGFG